MPSTEHRQALAELLRARRSELQPDDVGLPRGVRRRTPGLRRDEVAELAHISTTYYTYLEQARPVRPSPQILAALATALRLTPAEAGHLHDLAGDRPAPQVSAAEQLPDGVVELVERQAGPALVKGHRWDVLAANDQARELFEDWGGGGEPNLVRWMFTDPAARRTYVEWELEARAMLGRFRAAVTRRPDEPGLGELVADLLARSTRAREWWTATPFAPRTSGSKRLRHPVLGETTYDHVVLQLADDPDQTLVAYTRRTDQD